MEKWKIALMLVLFYFLGFAQGSVIKPAEVTKTVDSHSLKDWKQLKEIDDEVFIHAATLMTYCDQGYQAQASQDMTAMNSVVSEMNKVTYQLNKNLAGRSAVLKRLGY